MGLRDTFRFGKNAKAVVREQESVGNSYYNSMPDWFKSRVSQRTFVENFMALGVYVSMLDPSTAYKLITHRGNKLNKGKGK